MKQKRISNLSDEYINKLSYELFIKNSLEHTEPQKKKSVYNVINTHLDKRQKYAVILYYVKNKKMKQIAEYMDISIPTVSRLLCASKEIIKNEMGLKF